MAKLLDVFVSAALICDEYSKGIHKKVNATSRILKKNYANYELVVVDNGLNSKELQKLKELLPAVPCIRVIRLAKTVDIDTAVFAAVEAAIGDYICILCNGDPETFVVDFVNLNQTTDIVFGVADNLRRRTFTERIGARLFYWYNKKFLHINIPKGSTYFISINRAVANALTRTNRNIRHFRHLAKLVGFEADSLKYSLPESGQPYSHAKGRQLVFRAIDMVSNYSSHPLRVLTYLGVTAGLLNILYAAYVLVINFARQDIERGWTTLSLQSSIMFFILFMILAVMAEYIGKILVESRGEPPYHIMQELSSTISLADETRRNVTK